MRFNKATLNSRLLTKRIITVAAAIVLSVGTALAAQPATYHDVAAMDRIKQVWGWGWRTIGDAISVALSESEVR